MRKRITAVLIPVGFGLILFAGCGAGRKARLQPAAIRAAPQLPGSGKIYLVPLGKPREYSLEGLPEYYKKRFEINVELLPWVPLDSSVEDPSRHQAVAERLVTLMKRSHPELSDDPDAILTGITEQDMYIAAYDWQYAFNWRQEGRFAVVSVARMGSVRSVLQTRLRKILTKNVGLLYYQLPLSADPTSVLYGRIESSSDIDEMGEDFIGTFGVWKPMPEEGSPCITITQPAGHRPVWRFDCSHSPPLDTRAQSFLTDLKLGLFVQRKTDFYIDEPFPLVLARMYRPQDSWSRAFGIGTSHSLDIFLVGDAEKLSYIELILEDGGRVHYKRVSPGTGHANAEYESEDDSDSAFSNSRITWNGNGWDLERRDGWTFVFPASAGARRPQQAALIGMHDSKGHSFKLVRDQDGNLLHVTTPAGNYLDFEYDSVGRVTRAKDNFGRDLTYHYDAAGRLIRVEDSNGSIQHYSYDSNNQMLTMIDASGNVHLANQYDTEGNIVRQILVDGRVLGYRYIRSRSNEFQATEFTDPQGYVTRFDYGPFGYTQSLPRPPTSLDTP